MITYKANIGEGEYIEFWLSADSDSNATICIAVNEIGRSATLNASFAEIPLSEFFKISDLLKADYGATA